MFSCCSLVGADRPPKQAMVTGIACLELRDLGFGVLCWERKAIRAEKMADGRVPLPARSGYISGKSGYNSGEKWPRQGTPRRFSDKAG